MCTLQTGKFCYNAININYVLVLICRMARELNLLSVMVLRKGVCSYAQLCMLTQDKSAKL